MTNNIKTPIKFKLLYKFQLSMILIFLCDEHIMLPYLTSNKDICKDSPIIENNILLANNTLEKEKIISLETSALS